jgi:hypothetical protein
VESICAVLEFPPSTYWAAKKRESKPSTRAVRDEWLKGGILRVWHGPGRGLYGARKVWSQLNREGIEVARCTVERCGEGRVVVPLVGPLLDGLQEALTLSGALSRPGWDLLVLPVKLGDDGLSPLLLEFSASILGGTGQSSAPEMS